MRSSGQWRLRPAGLVIPLLVSAIAAAGSASAGADAELETVTVYARRIVPVTRVAATVTVIPREAIEAGMVGDAKELVRYEPGLTVRSDPFRFGLDSFAVRGVGGNRVAVEIDGIPAAGGFAVGSFSDSGRSFVDLAFVERVEVLRGPASSLYGSDAIGGVVAMTTLSPERLLQDGPGVRTEAGYASEDDGWHTALVTATTLGPVQALLGYVRREGGELATAADVTPNPRDYVSDSGLLRLAFAAAPGGPLTFTAEGGRIGQDTAIDAFLGQPGRFANTTTLLGEDVAERFRVSLDQPLAGGGPFDSADWRLYWQGTATRQDTYELRKAVPSRAPPLRIEREFRLEDRTIGFEFTALKEFTASSVNHDLAYGLEATRASIEERRDGLQTDLDTGATTPKILGETFPLRDFPLTTVTEAGVFLQDEIRSPTGGWSAIPAVRVDYHRLESSQDSLYLADQPGAPVVGLDEFSFAPKLGLIRAFGEGLTGYFQYAHGFRSPPPEDVNIGLELPLLNVRAIPNPDLRPEQSDGYEVGLRWRGASSHLTASAYYNDYSDFIESKVNLGPDPESGVILFQSRNVAEARIYGAELSGEVAAPVDAAAWLQGWSARLTAAWSRGEDLVRDLPLNSVDPASAVMALAYEPPSRRWEGRIVMTAVEGKREVNDGPVELYRTDGYLVVDMIAHLDLGRGLRLGAGVFNVTDEEYIEWADVRGRPAGDPLIPYYTRPGRSISLTVSWAL
jgi:hemoglobin/transferrin/lactoferrin receptor protein